MITRVGKFEIIRPYPRFLGLGPKDVHAHTVTYTSGDLIITGRLYEPSVEPIENPTHPIDFPAPGGAALLIGHGGIWGVPDHYDVTLRRLAKAGWTIAAPNYRGEGGSDGDIEFALGEADDTIACGDALASLPSVDPENIWLLGGSHGAMVNIRALAMDDADGFAGAVAVSGVYDISSWLIWIKQNEHHLLTDPFIQELLKWDQVECTKRSALSIAEKIDKPVFLVHGDSDTIVPVDQTESLAREFKRTGKTNYRVRIQPDADHEFIWGPDRVVAIDTWNEVMEFIN